MARSAVLAVIRGDGGTDEDGLLSSCNLGRYKLKDVQFRTIQHTMVASKEIFQENTNYERNIYDFIVPSKMVRHDKATGVSNLKQ